MKNKEDLIQLSVVNYLKMQYPQVRFMANYLSGARLPIYLARKAKKLGQAGQGTPDLFIFHNNGKYSMLVLELKVESPFKLNGMLKTNEHLTKQNNYLDYLNREGAYASFGVGVTNSIAIIDKYMHNEL
jgi:hypothetical protein